MNLENSHIEENFITYSDYPPIEERFGLEDTDLVMHGLLVLAPLDQVAEVVAQLGVRWQRDVYGQTLGGCGLLVFQFRGHTWTGILDGYLTYYSGDFEGFATFANEEWKWEAQGVSLSQKLNTRTIHYWCNDHSGAIGYACWENGTLMERLEYDDEIWQDTHDEALWELPDRPSEPHLFESRLRKLTAAEITNSDDFVEDFLCEQKAYAATRFSRLDFQPDDFVRVDYIAFT